MYKNVSSHILSPNFVQLNAIDIIKKNMVVEFLGQFPGIQRSIEE